MLRREFLGRPVSAGTFWLTYLSLSYSYTALFFRLSRQQFSDALDLCQIQSIVFKCSPSELSSLGITNSLMVWRVARADCVEKSAHNSCRAVKMKFGDIFSCIGIGPGKENGQSSIQQRLVQWMEKFSKRCDPRKRGRRVRQTAENLLKKSAGCSLREAREGWREGAITSVVAGPETRTTAIAERPGAVERA